ncbi:hypothetical protein CVS30_03845 [Arthrobacter psychrolactophilus]|uniref:Uncharacterized protein n=1 Tax=Arthrobacter psychrolactophilus TaxID=92442 RepID=A0A2V5IWC9_9MICC|nr:hypothetical protein CVS30_03845 [Arthrobacter psychrolactophilus]
MSTDIFKARSQVAVASRRKDTAGLAIARRNLAAAKLEAYVSRVVAEAPPLTPEQLDRVSVLLRPGGGAS